MGFEFVFRKDEEIQGYHLEYVKGVGPDGEYGVLEIPSSYCGLPVVGIRGIDHTEAWIYRDGQKKRPHFRHVIFPRTIGYVDGEVQIGRVDKLTLRGWTLRPGWKPSEDRAVRQIRNFTENDIFARGIAGFVMDADTVVFEGEEMPPQLFSTINASPPFAKIKRVVAPNVKIIGEDAFSGNRDVGEFELPYGLKAIGRGAFFNSGLKNIKIPSTVTYIGPYAFKPNQVDRASLRGRTWDFMVPMRHDHQNRRVYCRGHRMQIFPDKEELGKRYDELRYRIDEWLNAADPYAPTKYKSRYAGASLNRSDFFDGELRAVRCCDGFWFSFRKYALVCGADPLPKGMWYDINSAEPYYM